MDLSKRVDMIAGLRQCLNVKSHCKIGVKRNAKNFYFVREWNSCVSYSNAVDQTQILLFVVCQKIWQLTLMG